MPILKSGKEIVNKLVRKAFLEESHFLFYLIPSFYKCNVLQRGLWSAGFY